MKKGALNALLVDITNVDRMLKMVTIKWQKIHPAAVIPRVQKTGDAGADISSCENIEIAPRERKIVRTGLKVEIPPGYEMQVRPRSGLSAKTSLIIPNSPGTIDSGYRGEVGVIMWNTGENPYYIKTGDRIAQVVVQKIPDVVHEEVTEITDTERGTGGFGSTGLSTDLLACRFG